MKLNLKSTIAAPAGNNSCQKALNGIIGNTRRGIVVDKTLDPDSNNPVANKPVSTALAALAGQLAKGQVVFLDQLPESGEPHKVYVLTATNQRYWWDGSAFVKIVPTDIKDSATIKHTLAENKISLDLDETVKGKIDAALQKPTGLTKTELVGVGTNGQENIEIGDNLTLANGKLSATGGGGSIPVVDGTITSENTFALNETPTGDYFLAHLLYAGFVYVNSLMTKTTVTFGETNTIFYIGLIVLNGLPFLAYSATSEDGNSVNNVMKQICFMNNPYQSNGIIYFTNGGFDSLEFPADASTSTYVLKAVNGTVQWVKES